MADAIKAAAAAIIAKLAANSDITGTIPETRMYWPVAPQNRAYPYIVISCADAIDDGVFNGPVWTRQIWNVDCVYEEDADAAADMAGEINESLDHATLTITGFRSLCSYRQRAKQPRPMLGEDATMRYQAGGEYVIGVGV